MYIFGCVLISVLASLGVALMILEFVRSRKAKSGDFICLCFREELLENGKPDMLIICRTTAECDEVISRVCGNDNRKAYIKRY